MVSLPQVLLGHLTGVLGVHTKPDSVEKGGKGTQGWGYSTPGREHLSREEVAELSSEDFEGRWLLQWGRLVTGS